MLRQWAEDNHGGWVVVLALMVLGGDEGDDTGDGNKVSNPDENNLGDVKVIHDCGTSMYAAAGQDWFTTGCCSHGYLSEGQWSNSSNGLLAASGK